MTPIQDMPFCPHHGCVEKTLVRIEHSVESMREGFEGTARTLKEVAVDLREGAVTMATLQARLQVIERVVYGCVGLALTGIGMALLALVLKA